LDDEPYEPVMIPHGALAADLLRGIVEAVSYTHLDVYKRQRKDHERGLLKA